jgi:hypothetical protein
MGKVVGKPYRGKLDVRFDEGLEEIYAYAYPYQILDGWRSPWKDRFQQHAYMHNIALLYSATKEGDRNESYRTA